MHRLFVDKVDLSNAFLARFTPGEDLFERLKAILKEKGLERIAILSAIGSLSDVSFRDLKPGIERPVVLDNTNLIEEHGPFELLSLEGNVVPMNGEPVVHLHAILGTPDGGVIGGHMFKGTVFTTLEIFFAGVKGSAVHKERSEVTGLTEMKVE